MNRCSAQPVQVCEPQAAHNTAHRGVAIREFPFSAGQGFADYQLYIEGKAAGVIVAKVWALYLHYFNDDLVW